MWVVEEVAVQASDQDLEAAVGEVLRLHQEVGEKLPLVNSDHVVEALRVVMTAPVLPQRVSLECFTRRTFFLAKPATLTLRMSSEDFPANMGPIIMWIKPGMMPL